MGRSVSPCLLLPPVANLASTSVPLNHASFASSSTASQGLQIVHVSA